MCSKLNTDDVKPGFELYHSLYVSPLNLRDSYLETNIEVLPVAIVLCASLRHQNSEPTILTTLSSYGMVMKHDVRPTATTEDAWTYFTNAWTKRRNGAHSAPKMAFFYMIVKQEVFVPIRLIYERFSIVMYSHLLKMFLLSSHDVTLVLDDL